MARKRTKVGGEKFAPDLEPLARSVEGLQLDPANTRLHSDRNIDAVRASLRKFGQQKPIVANKDGVIIAGNGTLRAAILEGWERIAVAVFDGSEEDAIAYSIADNRSSELAEWDWQQLATHLQGTLKGIDLGLIGFEDYEIEPIMQAEWEPPDVDPDADFQLGSSNKPQRECPKCGHEW